MNQFITFEEKTMKTLRIKHTVIVNPVTKDASDIEKTNRRNIIHNCYTTITASLEAGKMLGRQFDIEEFKVIQGERGPIPNTIVVGWAFTFPVNGYFDSPTRQLFESLFHKNSMLDQYLTYQAELVEIDI